MSCTRLQLVTKDMTDTISSTLSDPMLAYMSCTFLENLAVNRVADVQQYDDKIIEVVKADNNLSGVACSLLAKLATDEVYPPPHIALYMGSIFLYDVLLYKAAV